MPWWDVYPARTIARLRALCPGLSMDEIAMVAMETPGYDKMFAQLGVKIIRTAGQPPRLRGPSGVGAAFAALVEAVHLGNEHVEHRPVDTHPRHRESDALPTETVLNCGARVRERLTARARLGARRRVPHELTQLEIALEFGVSRDRVRQIEGLLELGWPLGKSHPEYFPKADHVRLPSVLDAASLLAPR